MGFSGSTSKASSVVAAVCIVVYIAAVAFGAARIIIDIGERGNLAEREFFDLADRTTSSAVFQGFMSAAHQETIRSFFATSSILTGVIITGPGLEQGFERSPGSGIVWAGNSPRLRAGAGIPREPFFMPLWIDGQRNVTIQATYSFIDFGLFQIVLRDTLFAVMLALLIAFITLIIEFTNKKRLISFKTKTQSSPVSPIEDSPDELPRDFSSEPFLEPLAEEEMFAEAEKETRRAENLQEGDAGIPKGLYSPRSSIGWESYTQDRLDSELHRCSSFEQDLTFMVMEFEEHVPVYRQFADEAVNFFSMRDLIFEQGDNGISIILPNLSLEQGMAKAEEFQNRIAAKLPESFGGRDELRVGLTSRAGRIVDAKRLLLEAFSGLEKAMKERQSNIVAFKSDPEKYREFVKQNYRGS